MKHLPDQQSEYYLNIYNTDLDVSHETFAVLLIELFSIKGEVLWETFLLCDLGTGFVKAYVCQIDCYLGIMLVAFASISMRNDY